MELEEWTEAESAFLHAVTLAELLFHQEDNPDGIRAPTTASIGVEAAEDQN